MASLLMRWALGRLCRYSKVVPMHNSLSLCHGMLTCRCLISSAHWPSCIRLLLVITPCTCAAGVE